MSETLLYAVAASHRRFLLGLAARYVGQQEAEDVVQTALEKAWRASGRFVGGARPERDMLNWLCQITSRAAIDEQRRRASRPWESTDWWSVVDDTRADDDWTARPLTVPVEWETPEGLAVRAEERREARALAEHVLRRCNAKQRRALWWSYGLEAPESTLMRREGLTRQQIKGRLLRGRRNCLKAAA